MRSDALFYELFQAAPQAFFELLQITPPCLYHFESITVKSAEKRIDGVLEPEVEGERIYIVEIQAYLDKGIYWRSMREVATYFEQRVHLIDNDWQVVVLFLNSADDPGFGTLSPLAEGNNPRLKAVNLIELLNKLPENALSLNVLRPLVARSENEVRQNALIWAENIRRTQELSPEASQRLVDVLAQFITQRFTNLTYKEMSQMLKLTPLEETIDGRELMQNYGVKLLMEQIETKFSLSDKEVDRVGQVMRKLKLESIEELAKDILHMRTLDELEAWINNRLPAPEATEPSLN